MSVEFFAFLLMFKFLDCLEFTLSQLHNIQYLSSKLNCFTPTSVVIIQVDIFAIQHGSLNTCTGICQFLNKHAPIPVCIDMYLSLKEIMVA